MTERPAKRVKLSPVNQLPNELTHVIVDFLPFHDKLSFRLSCTSNQQIVESSNYFQFTRELEKFVQSIENHPLFLQILHYCDNVIEGKLMYHEVFQQVKAKSLDNQNVKALMDLGIHQAVFDLLSSERVTVRNAERSEIVAGDISYSYNRSVIELRVVDSRNELDVIHIRQISTSEHSSLCATDFVRSISTPSKLVADRLGLLPHTSYTMLVRTNNEGEIQFYQSPSYISSGILKLLGVNWSVEGLELLLAVLSQTSLAPKFGQEIETPVCFSSCLTMEDQQQVEQISHNFFAQFPGIWSDPEFMEIVSRRLILHYCQRIDKRDIISDTMEEYEYKRNEAAIHLAISRVSNLIGTALSMNLEYYTVEHIKSTFEYRSRGEVLKFSFRLSRQDIMDDPPEEPSLILRGTPANLQAFEAGTNIDVMKLGKKQLKKVKNYMDLSNVSNGVFLRIMIGIASAVQTRLFNSRRSNSFATPMDYCYSAEADNWLESKGFPRQIEELDELSEEIEEFDEESDPVTPVEDLYSLDVFDDVYHCY